MAEFMNLEYFAYICVTGEGDDKYWVFSDDSMSDPVYLVSWEIRTTCMLWEIKSARTSSSGMLDGTPFSTSQGCTASGSG